jgi:hypothetical protein
MPSGIGPSVKRMTNADYPWEPPVAGTEAEQLIGAPARWRPKSGTSPGAAGNTE